MIKRRLILLICALGLMLVLGSCNSNQQELKDGYYSAEMKNYRNGWKEFVTIRVSGGEIVSVEYNAKNASGFIKSWDMRYMRNMSARMGTYPNRYTRSYAAYFLDAQTPGFADTVTGASVSGKSFRAMCKALLEKARAGDATLAIVDVD
ncbi:MAG TPA: FMN-binding protein [Clostridiales bacterium]|jgi:major membrane immunogen (membrane-anchored lipoprotein)|nr:FMN-binding protein [Clostridiales bacterium]